MSQDGPIGVVLEAPTKGRKPYGSTKAPAIKNEVIVRRAHGQPKSHIAKELHIAHNTVNAILEESNIEKILANQQVESLSLIPEALRVARVRLSKDSEAMAIKVLENTVWPLDSKGHSNKMSGDTILQQTIQNLILPASSKPETCEDKAIVVEVVDNKG